MQIALPKQIESIKSLEFWDEPSGEVLVITFQNGSQLHVTPENDGFHFYRKSLEEQQHPTVSVMTHITGEHQEESDTSVSVGTSGKFDITLFRYD